MGYVINHCIACFQKEEIEKAKVEAEIRKGKALGYIAQGVEFLTANTAYIPYQADFKNGEGKQIMPFVEFMEDKPKDTRTAEEMVDDVMSKCGLLRG